jgi:hypothetical protein
LNPGGGDLVAGELVGPGTTLNAPGLGAADSASNSIAVVGLWTRQHARTWVANASPSSATCSPAWGTADPRLGLRADPVIMRTPMSKR